MSFDYSYVLPPSGPANNAEVREMFEDVKAYVNTLISGGGSGAPDNAQYVTLIANANLSAERVLTAGTGISLTDNGAGSTVVVANTGVTSITVSDPYINLSRSPATGAVTLSMTATPTYSSIILQSASGSIGITPSASVFTSYNLTLPLNTGTSGYILSTNGATPTATLSWTDPGTNFVTSVHGTVDQINVSGTTGSVTFSTPQDIATTSSPTFSKLHLGGGTSSSDPALSIGDSNTGFFEDSGGDGYVSLSLDGTIGTQWIPSTNTLWNTGPVQAPSLKLRNGSGQIVTISPNGSFTSYALTMPADDGVANQYLTTDGSGALSWTNAAGTGTVNTGNANTLAYYATATNAIFALSAITGGRALVSDVNGLPTHSVTTTGELAFVSGVTGAIQTALDAKAVKALSNLAAVAINTTLVSDTDNTDDLGTSSVGWKDVYLTGSLKRGSATALTIASSGDLTAPHDLTVTRSSNGGNVLITAENTHNADTNSNAHVDITVGGTSAGDPFTKYTVTGSTVWCAGIDNSASDSFKISKNSTLGTNDYLTIATSGDITIAGNVGLTGGSKNIYATTTSGSATVLSIGSGGTPIAVQNSKTLVINISGYAKTFQIYGDSGDGCLVTTSYTNASVTILGPSGGAFVASSTPSANQIGIFKSLGDTISIKAGSSAATNNTTISILVFGSVTSVTDWA